MINEIIDINKRKEFQEISKDLNISKIQYYDIDGNVIHVTNLNCPLYLCSGDSLTLTINLNIE